MKLFPQQKERTRELPVLPTSQTLIFPGHTTTLFVSKEVADTTVAAATTEGGRSFLAVPQREDAEGGGPDALFTVGTLVWILHNIRMPDGTVRLIVDGRERSKIRSFDERSGVIYGSYVQITPNRRDTENELPKLSRLIRDSFEEYAKLNPTLKAEARKQVRTAETPDALVDTVAMYVPFEIETRVAIFRESSTLARSRLVVDSIDGEVELLGLKRSIRDRVRRKMEQHQKDHFLNEQIREMRRELGHDAEDGDNNEELLRKIEERNLPEDVAAQAVKEARRLAKLPGMTPEAGIIRTYVEWLLDLPWRPEERDTPDIIRAAEILDEDHYDMEKPKERVLEYMAVQNLNPALKAPILCFIGPPGTGKTSLGKSMARALGRSFVRLSLGGVRDEAEIRGHRRTYVGAMPGRIIQAMKRAGANDPVILLDEIDKLGTDFRGDPASALLEVLDPEQNNTFSDHYIELPFDLSRVVFLTTANSLHGVPPALRDRLEIIEIPGYTEREKERIARDFLIPEQLKENGLTEGDIRFRRDGLHRLIREYTSESGVRNLKREIATIIRKLARELLEHEISPADFHRTIGAATVGKLLGPPRYRHDEGDGEITHPGVVYCLAWTENGGRR
ncbi:MAG: LON peptidase substrate-binding domain-containing protein [Alkalispirochaeta sp.]